MSSFTPSEQAVMHLVKRMTQDPRLAYLLGPGSESFELIKAAAAHLVGERGAPYRDSFLGSVKKQPVPDIGRVAAVVDPDLWDEILGVNNYELQIDQQGSVNYLVNHFVRLGLRAHRADVDQHTEELF